jgi:4-oxalocrotonate tautomerase
MPHVVVKMYPGRSEEKKAALTLAITKALMYHTDCDESSVSVDIEEIPPEEWNRRVYERDIRPRTDRLYKKPGYDPTGPG